MSTETTTKTRTTPMRWIKLGEGKDPEYDKDYFLTDGHDFYKGFLQSTQETSAGKVYNFAVGKKETQDEEGEDAIALIVNTDITHYAIPTKPAE